ncbi:MAG: lipocalin family protein [Gelidibacter sp.]|nr:lipocalin family protein [Gelidibacter sp.]
MKKAILLLLIVLTFGCSKNPENYIEHLNGYWEIDEVTLPDGTKRDYNYNDTIDFFSINDSLTGFRKKMKPNFDGSFSTSNDAETLKVVIENDSLNIYYQTPFAEWKETVLEATEDKLLIQNKDKLLYLYKRYEPIVIE